MAKSIRVKILKSFRNPKSNIASPEKGGHTKVGEQLNVVKDNFWIKRLLAKDCEQIKMPPKPKAQPNQSAKKGSK